MCVCTLPVLTYQVEEVSAYTSRTKTFFFVKIISKQWKIWISFVLKHVVKTIKNYNNIWPFFLHLQKIGDPVKFQDSVVLSDEEREKDSKCGCTIL